MFKEILFPHLVSFLLGLIHVAMMGTIYTTIYIWINIYSILWYSYITIYVFYNTLHHIHTTIGSIYTTIAVALERAVTVCAPFTHLKVFFFFLQNIMKIWDNWLTLVRAPTHITFEFAVSILDFYYKILW